MRHLALASLLLVSYSLAARAEQPVVAIHVSELTQALESMTAGAGTPSGAGTTGKEWWTPWWHYFVMSDALKEALRSDGTPFVVVTDADIAAGKLLDSQAHPQYPIVISLASEAINDNEVSPLRNYVSAGGVLFVGSASFTRRPDGTNRGDFALATEMGLHSTTSSLQNWAQNGTVTKQTAHPIVADLPSGTLNWMMPLTSDDISWGTDSNDHALVTNHYAWQVTAAGATVLASASTGPYITVNSYGQGNFIYHAAMQPLMGNGGWAPGMYAYAIFRRSIEWAFQSAGLPLLKVSPWPYQYNAAYTVRHDFENYQNEINAIEASAQSEFAAGAKGQYYFCTGTLRVEMNNSATSIASLRRAISLYGATIGSHNGGLPNANNTALPVSAYDYWHWGPDEVLDITPPGYVNGAAYASASIASSFSDLDGWFAGLNTNTRTWVSPYFNGTREASNQLLDQLGVVTAGDQKISPFPHWTISTQVQGKDFGFLTLPVSDWFINGGVAQSLEVAYGTADIDAAVDAYYNLGALINIYSHSLSTDTLPAEYIRHSAAKTAIWPVNSIDVLNWWKSRSPVQTSVSYSINSNKMTATATVSGATDANTAIELLIPNWTLASTGIQVKLNGAVAGPSSYRTYNQGIKILVGTNVSTVEVSYPLAAGPTAVNDFYETDAATQISVSAPGVLANDTGTGALSATLGTTTSHGTLNLNPNGSFVYTPAAGFSGTDSFTYTATDTIGSSNPATVSIIVNPSGTLFSDSFSSGTGTDPFWTTAMGTWNIASGAMTGTTSSSSYGFLYATGTWADYSVLAQVQFPAGAYGGGLGGRVNPATGAHYALWVYPEGSPGGSSTVALLKFSSWTSWSLLGQVSVPGVGTGSHVVKLAFQGSNIQGFFDGTQYLTASDGTLTSGGVSLDMWASTPYIYTVDNVSVAGLAPIAANDSYTVAQNGTLNTAAPGVLTNDNGTALTALLVTSTSHGTLSLQSTGAFTYTPAAGYAGPDSFTYQASSGGLLSNTATVSLTVTGPPPPVAVNDFYTMNQDGTLNIAAPGVLANDTGSSLTAVLVTPASHGNLSLQSAGAFTYTPAAGYNGPDSFTYQASSAGVLSNTATVSITVNPAGTLFSDNFSGGNGPDPLWTTYAGTWNIANGAMTGTTSSSSYGYLYPSGTWTDYSVQAQVQFPAGAYGGGIGGRLNPSNGAHYALWVYPEGSPGGAKTLALLRFSTWTSWTRLAQATLPSVGTGSHILKLSFLGNNIQGFFDGTQYVTSTDATLTSGSISLDTWASTPYVYTVDNVVVAALAPVAANDSYTVAQNGVLNTAAPGVLSNDSGTSLTAALVASTSHGTLSLQSTGAFTYTPTAGYAGADSFTYQASSGGVLSNTATVSITVTAPPPPVAANDFYSVAQNGTLNPAAPGVLANDTGSSLTALLVTSTSHGTLSLQSTGAFTYTPATGYSGADSFTYQASSAGVLSTAATVSITVNPTGTLFSDTFSTGNGTDPYWTTSTGTWNIANGAMTGTTSPSSYGYLYATGTWTDYSVQAQVQFPSGAYGGGVGARLNPSTGAHYALWVYPEGSPGGAKTIALLRFSSWTSWTLLVRTSLPSVGTGPHTVKLTLQGTSLQAFFDGTQYLTATNGTLTSGGISLDMWASTPYVYTVDNVSATQ